MTCEELGWFVVQVMVTEVDVMEPLATAEIVGGAAVVTKVELGDVAVKLDELVDTTSKS